MKKKLIYLVALIIVIVGTTFMTRNLSKPELLGDINKDGQINSMDMLLIKRHILDIDKLSYFEKRRADVNQDGEISNADIVMLRKYILAGE